MINQLTKTEPVNYILVRDIYKHHQTENKSDQISST